MTTCNQGHEHPDVVLTNPEWWRRDIRGTDLYVQISMDIGQGPRAVRLEYHPGDPSQPCSLAQSSASLERARKRLIDRGFERVDRL